MTKKIINQTNQYAYLIDSMHRNLKYETTQTCTISSIQFKLNVMQKGRELFLYWEARTRSRIPTLKEIQAYKKFNRSIHLYIRCWKSWFWFHPWCCRHCTCLWASICPCCTHKFVLFTPSDSNSLLYAIKSPLLNNWIYMKSVLVQNKLKVEEKKVGRRYVMLISKLR